MDLGIVTKAEARGLNKPMLRPKFRLHLLQDLAIYQSPAFLLTHDGTRNVRFEFNEGAQLLLLNREAGQADSAS